MSELEIKANAMLNEVGLQRTAMADRAAYLAGDYALLKAENEALKKRLSELEKPKPE